MDKYLPVGHLSIYRNKSFRICSRVVRKDFRDLAQDKALLTVDLMDNHGEMIRSKMWGDEAKKWDPIVMENKVYEFENGKVAVANKRFNNLPHMYELTFDKDSSIKEVTSQEILSAFPDTPTELPDEILKPVKLRTIFNDPREPPFYVDLIGVVHSFKPTDMVVTKRNGENLSRRTLVMVDDSGFQLNVTLFGKLAEMNFEDQPPFPTISISKAMIREYRGKTGQATSNSKILLGASTPEHETMKKWWENDSQEFAGNFKSMQQMAGEGGATGGNPAELKTIEGVFEESQNMSPGESRTFEILSADVERVMYKNREQAFNAIYPACPTCNKKVLGDVPGDSGAQCENCNKLVQPSYRYMCSVALSDSTGSRLYATAFDTQLSKLIGCDANTMKKNLDLSGGKLAAEDVEKFEFEATFKPVSVILRAQMETYQGESRPRYRILNMELSLPDHARKLLSELGKKMPGLNSLFDTRKRKMSLNENPNATEEESMESKEKAMKAQ